MKLPGVLNMPWDLVVFLSITTVGFGFSVQKLHINHAVESVANASSSREIASDSSPVITSSVLDLGCIESRVSHDKIVATEPSLRIKGRLCGLSRKQMQAFGGVRIKNLTTGTEGTIFMHGLEPMFVSDLLALNVGKNVIQLEWQDTQSSRPKQIISEVYER